jgi:hypothetical protein
MARIIWGHDGLGFRVCKLWGDLRWAPNGAQMLSSYKRLYDDINSVQPNMIWLYGATGQAASEGLENYAARHAQVIADCKAGGLVFQYVGTCNEPNDRTLYAPTQAAEVVKDFRAELDKRGLQNVKILLHGKLSELFRDVPSSESFSLLCKLQRLSDKPAQLAIIDRLGLPRGVGIVMKPVRVLRKIAQLRRKARVQNFSRSPQRRETKCMSFHAPRNPV